jgi:hypothetical protein
MAFFIIKEPNKAPKYIKDVNGAEGTIEFTEDQAEAYYKDSGFFADSEFEFIKFHFKEKYPEIEFMEIDNGYRLTNTWTFNNQAPNAVVDAFNLVQDAEPNLGDAIAADEDIMGDLIAAPIAGEGYAVNQINADQNPFPF